ncbi:N-acetyltransferase family protein [Gilvimarinus sp. F26214L]|uniref:GNAT family N-acetyltransferase n=1 Tax=Gilvimarinus sp. DZF01 TaxID=3461371 RepID=UPI004045FB2E
MKRLAEISDQPAVFSIYMHESVVPYLGYDPMDQEAFGPIYRDLIADGTFYVYEVDGEVAGFYRSMRRAGRTRHVAMLGTLAVAPAFQGSGLAKKMVEAEIRDLKASGISRIQLTVESDNARAIRFYERLGFSVEGRLRNYYKRSHESHYVDDLMMALLI